MYLSDATIRKRLALPGDDEYRIAVEGLAPDAIQPCSIDVYLGNALKVYTGPVMDTRRDNSPWWHEVRPVGQTHDDPERVWVLQRGAFYLGVLKERIRVPRDCACVLGGVSTMARQGIVIHQQAGHLDPGYHGYATLEITVVGAETTILTPGTRIGQVTFVLLDAPCEDPYHGRYQGDTQPQPARLAVAA